MKNENLVVALLCYAIGLFGLIGIFVEGAWHQAMNVAVCLIFGSLYLVDYLGECKRQKELAALKAPAYEAPTVTDTSVEVERGIAISGD